jgi:hypothetical protein
MAVFLVVLFLTGLYPLRRAWLANRRTSLLQAVNWAITAWLAWVGTFVVASVGGHETKLAAAQYLSLCLTGCAGVAVLGARRPHVGAWNFVVLGLLAVLMLPLLEKWFANQPIRDPLRIFFLGATLSVGFLNYLPTRLAPALVLAAFGCSGEMALLFASGQMPELTGLAAPLCLAFAPWAGMQALAVQTPPDQEIDRIWLDFRNRYGLMWAQRVREQFNRAAFNAGWSVYLSWQGVRRLVLSVPETAKPEEIVAGLQAILQRFMPDDRDRPEVIS